MLLDDALSRPTAGRADRTDARRGRLVCRALALCTLWLVPMIAANAQEAAAPHWIWRPGDDVIPAETNYFRKIVNAREPSRLSLFVTADDAFELFLDGRKVAEGTDWRTPVKVEIPIETGRHILSAWASNAAPGKAGFLVSGGVLPLGQGAALHTNSTWKVSAEVPNDDSWKLADFDDSGWLAPRDLGEFGVAPWGRLATGLDDPAERYRTAEGFRVETVAPHSVSGSVIAFTFDPSGAPCVSIERGPIARLVDEDGDGKFEKSVVIADAVTNCQGLHFAKGALFAVGVGPEEHGIHRLTDEDGDGVFETVELIRGVDGGMGEHGPHAILYGPDGRLYYNSGNHSHLKEPIDPASPLNVMYEGELLPHMNDSRGHAAGIMAPGGEIYRSDDHGATWKRIVGGFRNQYDFAFNARGELFSFDSDMEWDLGVPWYRPVRVNHCPIGTELGWRNGSADWPEYYFDSLPATLDLGRGSPTGVTFYQAQRYPESYRDQFIICDWSQGRILAVELDREGGSYHAKATELVSGQPLNCTDVETGPDGCLYFSNGGRGTQGGLFRIDVVNPPSQTPPPKDFLIAALAIDSPLSSYSQKTLEDLKAANLESWGTRLEATARDSSGRTDWRLRTRALEVMSQVGPEPGEELLITLASDPDAEVRSRAVSLLGYHQTDASRKVLTTALADEDAFVRRHAAESLMQQPAETIPAAALLPLLGESDRFIRFTARTALEHAEPSRLRGLIELAEGPRARLEAMLALVRATTIDQATQDDLFDRELLLLRETLEPSLQLDLLRLIQLTYLLGPQNAEAPASQEFRHRLLAIFSEKVDTPVNREVAKLLAYLDEPAAVAALLEHQDAVADTVSQIHDAYCLRVLTQGWDLDSKKRYWSWFDRASTWDGGYSYLGFLDMMIVTWLPALSPEERQTFLADGELHPFPTRVLVRAIEGSQDPTAAPMLADLYGRLLQTGAAGPQVDDLKSTILEKLGRDPGDQARASLRTLLDADPASRDRLIRALAERPSKVDLPIFASALDSRDENTLRLILRALHRIEEAPDSPEAPAALIRLARRATPPLQGPIRQVAGKWLGIPENSDGTSFGELIVFWDGAYRAKHPDGPATTQDALAARSRDLAELVKNVLEADVRSSSSAERGAEVIARIRCLDCHKFGDQGQGLGPDLTTISSRFQPVDILDAIVSPSKVISDQYKTITVAIEDGRVVSGMPIVTDGPDLVLLISDGSKITIPKTEIEEEKPAETSVMPEGLIDALSDQEIADLIALFESAPRVDVSDQATSP